MRFTNGPTLRLTTGLLIALVVALAQAQAHAGPGTEAVRKTNESLCMLLTQPVEPGSDEAHLLQLQMAHEVGLLLDINEVGRQAMQDHLDAIGEKQFAELQELLGALIEQSYTRALHTDLRYDVEYVSESGRGNREVVTRVRTTRRGRPYTTTIVYRLHKRGGRWRAYDVVTDGASLASNYQAQFNRIIAKEGVSGLLARMQQRHRRFEPRDSNWATRATVENVPR